ncbi:hypothetical protein JOD31_002102 [Methylopila capsulata]|uniref:Mitochondrial inner membrane protein n=1 Tax=Methylopila capsulata TaxID=61654 RepID=A0A9W6MR61_9HYPH|nr:hypothetical protein [Methylopila capsulata]MBM7851877.1 hypothetical protein [Methylopila capsulata]GLK54942.1 hypothetical protein GCM10008170_09610 [Methylopila capsulata]
MADPKGPETTTGGGAPSARPKAPTLDLKAADVTPKDAAKDPSSATATPADPKDAPKPSSPASTASAPQSGAASPTGAPDAKAADVKQPSSSAAAPASAGPTSAGGPGARPAGATPSFGGAKPTESGSPKPGAATGPDLSKTGAKSDSSKSDLGKGEPGKPADLRPSESKPSESKPVDPKPADTGAPTRVAAAVTPARGGAGVLGLAGSALFGAAIALGVVALYGQELIGGDGSQSMRVTEVESKLDAVGLDVAALRERSGQTAQTADTSAIEARISELARTIDGSGARVAALEGEIRGLAGREQAPTVDPAAVDALTKRVDGLESKIADMPTREAIAELGARIDAAVKPLDEKIAALDAALKARPVGDPAARLVTAFAAIDQAVAAGRPFPTELAAAKAAGGDVAALEPYAAGGAPTKAALGAELKDVMAKLPSLKPAADASVFDRLVASAGSVVKVTPATAPAGSAPADVRARVAAKASASDVEGALADIEALDPDAKAATAAWADKAKARLAADEALATARTAALARLGATD